LATAEDFAHQQLADRLLEPEEPGAFIAWLCSVEASGVTGAALSVDGGLTTS
jgi:NAD(P)-dependent dehydrogenase (short-subunit alcohol dehydrogenase family)